MASLKPWLAALTVLYCIAAVVWALWDTSRWQQARHLAAQKAATANAQPKLTLLPDGSPATSFALQDAQHKTYDLTQVLMHKKWVLLEFFATWCPHCQRSVPALNQLVQSDSSIQVLGINAGDLNGPNTTTAFVAQFHPNYPLLLNPDLMLLKLYALQGFPTLYLVDQTQTVRWAHTGELQPNDVMALQKALAKP